MTIMVTYNKQKKMTTIATHKAQMFDCATKLEKMWGKRPY
jgi:hypothetical protein